MLRFATIPLLGAVRFAAIVLFACFSLTSCAPRSERHAPPLVVGALLPLTGPESDRGTQVLAGIKLAFSLGPADPAIEVRAFDVEDSPSLVARRVESLALDSQVIGLVTGWSAATARTICADSRREDLPTLLLSPLSFPTEDMQVPGVVALHRLATLGEALAEFAHDDLQVTRAAVLEDPRSETSRVLTKAFTTKFVERGGRISWRVTPESPTPPQGNPASSARSRQGNDRSASAEDSVGVAFVAAPPLFLESVMESKSLGSAALLFAEGWAPPSSDLPASPQITGYVASFASEADPGLPAREFRASCERAGLRPTDAVAFGYDAGRLIQAALESGARTREQIQAAWTQLGAMEGATGRLLLRASADSCETPAISTLTPSGWAFRRRVVTRN